MKLFCQRDASISFTCINLHVQSTNTIQQPFQALKSKLPSYQLHTSCPRRSYQPRRLDHSCSPAQQSACEPFSSKTIVQKKQLQCTSLRVMWFSWYHRFFYSAVTSRQNISSKNLTKNMSLRHFPNQTWKAYSKYIILRTPASPGTSAGLPQKQLPCVRICGGSMSWYHDATNAMDLSMVFCWRVWCIGICLQNWSISCNKHL